MMRRINPDKKPIYGAEKKVYETIDNGREVIALFHNEKNPRSMKGRYYLTKILHQLFPEEIPDISFAGGKDGKGVTVAEKIQHDSKHHTLNTLTTKFVQNGHWTHDDVNTRDRIEKEIEASPAVRSLVKKLRTLGVTIDDSGWNFSKRNEQTKTITYLETIEPWFDSLFDHTITKLNYNPTKIHDAIQNSNMEPLKKKRAFLFLERLLKITEEQTMAEKENQIPLKKAA